MTQEQFENNILPLQDQLYRYAVSILFDVEAGKDIVQEVLLKLWKQREKLDQIENLSAWCIRLTRNTCLDRLRSPKNKMLGLEQAGTPLAQRLIPDVDAEQNDLVKAMHRMLKDLPTQQQEIFRLHDIMGYSNREIEELLQLNDSQVKVNLCRARQKIRKRLTQMINYGLSK